MATSPPPERMRKKLLEMLEAAESCSKRCCPFGSGPREAARPLLLGQMHVLLLAPGPRTLLCRVQFQRASLR
eukprot:15448733-Alexandrium_andersonii.AAC.1